MNQTSSEEGLKSDKRNQGEEGSGPSGPDAEDGTGCFKCGKAGHFKKDCKGPEVKKEEPIKKIPFSCSICGISEKCHYLGTKPPFCKAFIEFEEECFVIIDPFTPRQSRTASNFLVIGGVCSHCKEEVCVECSIYFTKRFCMKCSEFNINEFPKEIQGKIVKKASSVLPTK